MDDAKIRCKFEYMISDRNDEVVFIEVVDVKKVFLSKAINQFYLNRDSYWLDDFVFYTLLSEDERAIFLGIDFREKHVGLKSYIEIWIFTNGKEKNWYLVGFIEHSVHI